MAPACLRLAAATALTSLPAPAFPPAANNDPALTRAMFIALVLLTVAAALWVLARPPAGLAGAGRRGRGGRLLAFALPLAGWLGLLAALACSGFLLNEHSLPPRVAVAFLPAVLGVPYLAVSRRVRGYAAALPGAGLPGLQEPGWRICSPAACHFPLFGIPSGCAVQSELMVATAQDPETLLGIGLYTPAEAALYARLHAQTLSRWVHGTKSGPAAVRAQLPPDAAAGEKIITFLDFIQSLAIRAIRTTRRVPLSKIREAVTRAEEEHGVTYPFARPHTTYLLGDEVFIDLKEGGLVHLTGREGGQYAMKRIVEVYLEDLHYDASGLASRYTPFRFKGHAVVLDPHQMFGEPVVESCRYTARTLWEAAHAEGSFKAAAEAFGVTPDEVEAGFRYYDTLVAAS